jgi:hypothetical protein
MDCKKLGEEEELDEGFLVLIPNPGNSMFMII